MPAWRTTAPHFSVSARMNAPNWAGVISQVTPPMSAMRFFTAGIASTLATSACSRSMLAGGVFAGATSPTQTATS